MSLKRDCNQDQVPVITLCEKAEMNSLRTFLSLCSTSECSYKILLLLVRQKYPKICKKKQKTHNLVECRNFTL